MSEQHEVANKQKIEAKSDSLESNEEGMAKEETNNNVTLGTVEDVKRVEIDKNMKKNEKKSLYTYRDFGKVAEEEFDAEYEIEQDGLQQALDESTAMAAVQAMHHTAAQNAFLLSDPTRQVMRASGWVRSQRFPVKLYALLNQPDLSEVITWMPHGRSWKVLKPRIFETTVLPVFFESDNYHSFNRVINAWSFRRKSTGSDRGSYFHELFLRGKPHLQKFMRRLPKTHKKLAMKKEEEPDFFVLSQNSPLPSLEEIRAAYEMRKVQRYRNQLMEQSNVAMSQTPIVTNFASMNHQPIYTIPPMPHSFGGGMAPRYFAPPSAESGKPDSKGGSNV